MRLQFPEGFLLGVSSASAQIEGGEVGSNWNDWYHQGRIKDDSDPAVADDHWNRWREDCALMAGLHLPIARMGVEWARIMPARGEVDEAAIAHYRAELEYMRQLGIRPLLTIHHFLTPCGSSVWAAFQSGRIWTIFCSSQNFAPTASAIWSATGSPSTSRTSTPQTAISSATGLPAIKAFPRRSRCWKIWPSATSAAIRCSTRRAKPWAIPTPWSALRTICAYLSRKTRKIPCRPPRPEPSSGCFRAQLRRLCPQACSACR